jgi:glutamate carboxypeptidase
MRSGGAATGRRMLAALADLVGCESPSEDLAATATCARLVTEIGAEWLGEKPEAVGVGGRTHLRWGFGGEPEVVLVGHFDTVWPVGTLAGWPFAVDGDRATGPGVFDMKAGIVVAFAALAALEDRAGVTLLLTSDEELGSPTSRALIEDTARGARAALILEPGVGEAVKTGRKGVSIYELRVTGRAAHAGLEPERGVNAAVELAHQILAVASLADPPAGTTVTPSLARAGTTTNTVPADASVWVDARALTTAELERVDAGLRALAPVLPEAQLAVDGGVNRPPLDPAGSTALFALAGEVAAGLGQPPLAGVTVGGGSDGNFTAALGVPTLDGLGAVGANAHAAGEWASVAAMPRRAALVAEITTRLLQAPLPQKEGEP